MEDIKYFCKKCNNDTFYKANKGKQVGLYCDKCNMWYKWLSKAEQLDFDYMPRLGTEVITTTNYDNIIKDITPEKLAPLLVSRNTYDNGDYSFDGEDEYWVESYETYFTTPASDEWYSDYSDALRVTLDWLMRPIMDD